MSKIRLPAAVCTAVAETLEGSHESLNALFEAAGAPGTPPDLAHHSKWKTWLQKAGNDPEVDSLQVLGNLIEEFMDLPPSPKKSPFGDFIISDKSDPVEEYEIKKKRLITILEEHGFRYFRGGKVIQEDQEDRININLSAHHKQEGLKPRRFSR
ncbi:hypothetical protein [Oleiphilus sp. HI0086]|uniref:hypothetical protein n=1 Tax=Oleiphilus sp. HI0086 TaxID=1822260 RepID=UPI0007C30E10|nr:hypothetical protein [Oleiphilus sp. HI0086]KZZ35347.1 hypothetical protein A3756_15915 [Oleiphilus sp. HI0086]